MPSRPYANSADTTIRKLVIDASVAIKWFLEGEPDADLAEEILTDTLNGDLQLHAPNIFLHEVDGALTRACLTRFRRGGPPRLTRADALDALETLAAYPITVHPSTLEDRQQILGMAVDFSRGNYDMIYLHLAEKLDCQWCTADSRVILPTRTGFPIHRVLLLSALRVE